jgi:hypothetical protein
MYDDPKPEDIVQGKYHTCTVAEFNEMGPKTKTMFMNGSQLPPRTEEEEEGIRLMQDFFDFEVDYCKGGPLVVEEEEKARLMNLGWTRFNQEEFEEFEAWKERK